MFDLFNRQKVKDQAASLEGQRAANEGHHADNALLAGRVNTLERELIEARAAIIPNVSGRRNLAYILAQHEAKAVFNAVQYGEPVVRLTFKPQLTYQNPPSTYIHNFMDWKIVKALAVSIGYAWDDGIVCVHKHLNEDVGKNVEAISHKLQTELDNYLKLTRYQAIAKKEKADGESGKTKD